MHDNEEPRKVGALKQFLPEPSVDLVEQVATLIGENAVTPYRGANLIIPLIQKEVKEKILKDARFNLSRLRAPEQYETETGARCNAWFLTPKQWRDFWQSLKGGN